MLFKNRAFVYTLALVVCGFLWMGSTKKTPKPNVLFIAIDDLRTDLGCYGNEVMKTPNMDDIAAKGALFTKHYVQVPTCGASRLALLRGMRPFKRIHLSNEGIEKELSDQPEMEIPETFIHQMKRNGYHTVGIGKISHSADGLVYGYEEQPTDKRELPHSWSELLFNPGKWKTGWNAFFAYANGENRQSLNNQVKPYEHAAVDDNGYPDGLTAGLAIEKLKELKNRKEPFFLGVGFFKPHLPFNAPQKYWDMYDEAELELAENPFVPQSINTKSLHGSGEFNRYALGEEKAGLGHQVSDAYAKKIRHAYYASVSYADAQVGRLMTTLKELELDKNTIIVIWGDHGWHLGEQRVWGKHTLFENALKSALIVQIPKTQPAHKIDRVVETVDIYPTLMDLCHIKTDYALDGQSLKPLLESKRLKSEEKAYAYFNNGITLRTERYRLTKYFREEQPNLELYDHQKDPHESNNIAKQEPELLARLLPILEKGNTGLYGE